MKSLTDQTRKTLFASPENLKIEKMLTLSTAHIDKETCDILANIAENPDAATFPVYNAGDWGWFIPVNNHIPNGSTRPLTNCIVAALAAKCDWLCLDADGPVIADIPTYEWE